MHVCVRVRVCECVYSCAYCCVCAGKCARMSGKSVSACMDLCLYFCFIVLFNIQVTDTYFTHQVDYIDSSRNQAVLQMIPRVDYNRKRGHLRSQDPNELRKTRRRPPQKFFDAEAIR